MFEYKKALFGAGMFGLGAFSGYFVSKKMFNDQFRKDVADIQAFYKEKLVELGVMDEGFEPPEDPPEEDDEDDEDGEDAQDDPRSMAVKKYRDDGRRVVDYTKYSKPPLADMKKALNQYGASVIVQADGDEHLGDVDDDDDDEEYTPRDDPEYEAELEKASDEYARRRSENMRNGTPYLIEPEEYHEGVEDYERQALYYYATDRTLCEDDDQKVENEEEIVGFDYEDKLDMQTTCWVRNDQTRVLYEIHRINDSYKTAVLGISETPREREFRLQGRRKKALDDQPVMRKKAKSTRPAKKSEEDDEE